MLKQRGFTLLEAIVSLVIITSVGMALFSWINSNLMILQRVQFSQQRIEAMRNTLVFMQQINPAEKAAGKEILGHYQIAWQSHVVEPPKEGVSTTNDLSLFEVSLYDTVVTMSLVNENTFLGQFTLRQIGYKQIHKFEYFF